MFWGASSSSYQVEGGNKNDWSGVFDAGRATDHYNRFNEDFDLARSMGHNAHRFSIEWSRIEPEEGKFNLEEIEHYKKVILSLRERGMEPFVTIWHFTNPVWFAEKGGFENPDSVKYFARYANMLAYHLGDSVKYWITINEPMIYAANSFFRGIWPPGKHLAFLSYFKVVRNLILSHKSAYEAIHKNVIGADVGIAKNNIYFESDEHIWHLLNKVSEYWWNRYFLNKIKNHQDFIGLNYYFHKHVREPFVGKEEIHPKNDLGWAINPEGLYYVLEDLKRYSKPIYITENGIADANDEKRAQFIREHLMWMRRAMANNADVRGYFYWSLTDNFEWDKGFGPRFGLIEIDYSNMERTVRKSAHVYRDIIKSELRIKN